MNTNTKLIKIADYASYNQRRYGTPWIAKFNPVTGRPVFDGDRVGGYTGGYNTGDAGSVYAINPCAGDVYAFGQKDYRGSTRGAAYQIAVIGADGQTVSIMTRAEYMSGMVIG